MDKKISPQGYMYGSEPFSEHPFWGNEGGGDGAVYTPVLTPFDDETGKGYTLSWTNDDDLPNPDPVKIYDGTDGKDGVDGTNGADGADGSNGVTFIPSVTPVSAQGGATGYMISWTNDGELPNPSPVYVFNGINGTNGRDGTDGQSVTAALHGYWIDPATGDEVDVTYSNLEYLEVNPTGDKLILYFSCSDYGDIVNPNTLVTIRSVPATDESGGTDDGKVLQVNPFSHLPEWATLTFENKFPNPTNMNVTTLGGILSSCREFYLTCGTISYNPTQAFSTDIVLDELFIRSTDGTTINRKISLSDIISVYYKRTSESSAPGSPYFTIHGFKSRATGGSYDIFGWEIMDSLGYMLQADITIADIDHTHFVLSIPLKPTRVIIQSIGGYPTPRVFYSLCPGVVTATLADNTTVDVEILPVLSPTAYAGEVLKLGLGSLAQISYR